MFRVYVDESGGRHISPRSDQHFVLSGVMVHDPFNDVVRDQLAGLKVALGRHAEHVLHFSTLKRDRRPAAAAGVAAFDLATVISVIICKNILGDDSAGATPYIAKADPMYLWAFRLLLERVSWYARDTGNQQAIVTFGHVRGLRPAMIHAYRKALEDAPPEKDVRIEWSVFEDHPFRIASPRQVDLLQIADVTASSTFHAVEPGKNGDEYLRLLRPKLYRRNGICAPTYGLAVFPKAPGKPGGYLAGLASLAYTAIAHM
jgi:hypothetical protein